MTDGLIPRCPGDDVIVLVRMRRSSFEELTSTDDGRSVSVSEGMIGLVRDTPATIALSVDAEVYTFVIWSGEPVWRGVPEQIPGNREAAEALAGPWPDDSDTWPRWPPADDDYEFPY